MTIKLSSLKRRNQFKKRLPSPQVGVAKSFGNFGDQISKWIDGGVAPNGNIYCAPYNASSVLKIDPIVGSASTIPIAGIGISANYRGSVIGKNGKLYGIPSGLATDNNRVLEFDPKNNAYKFFSETINDDFFGGVLAQNGKIYGIPFQLVSTPSILEIDPIAGISTTFSSSVPAGRYAGGVLASNGKIYCIPYTATSVLEIDPVTKTTSTFGTFSGGIKWQGGVLASNGKIYGLPYNTTSVLEIDPISRTVSTFGDLSDVWSTTDPGWWSGVFAADGHIYGFGKNAGIGPSSALGILKIDPINKTLSLIYSNISANLLDVSGATIGPDGNIYTAPSDSPSVLSIGVSAANKSPQWVTKPYEVSPRCGFNTSLGNVGIATTTNQYYSGCLAMDGNIYAMPFGLINYILKIDPIKEIITEQEKFIPYEPGIYGGGYGASIALKDGRICGIPYYRNKALFYDPKSKQYTESNEVNGQWAGGSLSSDGKIYCPGIRSRRTLVIDPVAGTASTSVFPPIGTADDPFAAPSNWSGGVIGPNGKIYGIPSGETSVLEIDPVAGIQTTFGTLSSSNYKWYGGILAPNGKIYCTPNSSTSILKIDPIARTATTFGNTLSVISSQEYIYSVVLGSDGKIYYPIFNSNKILRLDPDTEQLSVYTTLGEYGSFGSAVLAPNGNIYTIPAGAGISTIRAKVVSIGTTQSHAPANWMLSSYTNKSI